MLQSTYFLAPRLDCKPTTGPIALGNIIADPLRPHRSLTTIDQGTLEQKYPRIETSSVINYATALDSDSQISAAIWAQFLETVSAKFGGSSVNRTSKTYSADGIKTQYFVCDPSLEEIMDRLGAPRVRTAMKAGRIPGLRSPVYMVTGLKIATNLTAQTSRNKGSQIEMVADTTIPVPPGNITIGSHYDHSIMAGGSAHWESVDDIVFAYQLLRIEIKGWREKAVEYDEFRPSQAEFLGSAHFAKEAKSGVQEEEGIGELTTSTANKNDVKKSGSNVVEINTEDYSITCISTIDM